jgi:hypothetical protein
MITDHLEGIDKVVLEVDLGSIVCESMDHLIIYSF